MNERVESKSTPKLDAVREGYITIVILILITLIISIRKGGK